MAEIRRYRRFGNWDYKGRGASLFITIATAPRRACFGHVVGDKVALSPLGEIVAGALVAMGRLNPGVTVFGYVVMPDHVHFNVHVAAGLDEPLKALGRAILRFKNFTTKQARILGVLSTPITTCPSLAGAAAWAGPGASMDDRAGREGPGASMDGRAGREGLGASMDGRAGREGLGASMDGRAGREGPGASMDGRAGRGLLWQQGYHDRLCLTRAFIEATERYIAYNPLKWTLMYQSTGALALHEPLDSPRLSVNDYWKGVGNVALLGPENKIVSLRVSRRLNLRQEEAALQRMMRAVDAGFTVLSGFISPGEKRIRDALCARKDARFIRILPACLPNRRFKPESRYVQAFAESRYLEIAQGNDEADLTRGICLAYNEEIIEIAKAGAGRAVYFTPQGMEWL